MGTSLIYAAMLGALVVTAVWIAVIVVGGLNVIDYLF
ncbi:hypothetical protein MMMDOFMJ_4377 [Methylobacterium gnaphalii]|nr:hypothetical protein MMMDOFMJ_4377 [Methylobacterium gnaphalii]